MGTLGYLASFSCQTHAVAAVWLCKCKDKGQGFETGERLLEISGRIEGLQWWKRRQNVCSLRSSQSRGPLWRGRVLNNDSMQAVQAMKRAKGDPVKIDRIIEARVSRLVKVDMLAVLKELERQDECHLALKVFDVIREEVWYKPDLSLYAAMIRTLKRNNLTEKIKPLFAELEKECLQPDTRAFTHLLSTFLRVGLPQNAMETYYLMKQSGCKMEEYTFKVLINGLQSLGEFDLAVATTKEYKQFLDGYMGFLEDGTQDTLIT